MLAPLFVLDVVASAAASSSLEVVAGILQGRKFVTNEEKLVQICKICKLLALKVVVMYDSTHAEVQFLDSFLVGC